MVRPTGAQVNSGTEETRSVALGELPRKLAYMQTLWQKLLYVHWDAQALELVRRLVHEIRSLAAEQGLDEAVAIARKLEQQLQVLQSRHEPPPETERGRLQGFMQRLAHALLDAHAEPRPPSAPAVAAVEPPLEDEREDQQDLRRHICILRADRREDEAWMARLRHAGYELRLCAGLDVLRSAMQRRRPDLLLAEVSLAQGDLAGVDVIDALHSEFGADIPVLFMAARGDLDARLAAVRAGGLGYFQKPVDEDELLRRIEELAPHRQPHFRILIVEDEEQLASAYALVLQQAGFIAQVLTQPLQIMQVLQQFQPDLLLMDLHLPECSGGELMQLIRQDPAFDALPIIFLSGDADPARHNAVLSQGADAFLLKPIKPQQLVAAVAARINRARMLRRRLLWLSQRDALTGLLNQHALRNRLDRHLADMQEGAQHPAALLYLEIDQYRILRDRHGLAALDLLLVDLAAWLKTRITVKSSLAHLGEGSFGVLLPNQNAATARELALMLCDAVAAKAFCMGEESVALTFSIGLATPQPEFRAGLEWLGSAALACDNARAAGGARVEMQGAAAVDVADHERHAHYARLLRAALEADGFRCVYQPIASLSGQAVERYDVLLRAQAADGQELDVERMFSVAREERMLGAIDRWVVAHVLDVLRRRAVVGDPTVFFVKLSAQTLNDPGAGDWIGQRLSEVGVEASSLVFEFDEADVVTSLRAAFELTARLRALGCGIALEHFGVAPGAAQLLDRLPVDYVKLDAARVPAITRSADARQRLRSLLEGAAATGAQVIAGFVEDAASLTALWQCGVRLIQGNFLQKPDAGLSFDFRDELIE